MGTLWHATRVSLLTKPPHALFAHGVSLHPGLLELLRRTYTRSMLLSETVCQMASSLAESEMKRVGRRSLGTRRYVCLSRRRDASSPSSSSSLFCFTLLQISSSHFSPAAGPSVLKLRTPLDISEPPAPTILFPVLQNPAWLCAMMIARFYRSRLIQYV